MSDLLLLLTLGVMCIGIAIDIYRVKQYNDYIRKQELVLEQNKIILADMHKKRKEIQELCILFERLNEINETINP